MKSASAGTPIQSQVFRAPSRRLNSAPRSEFAFFGVESSGGASRSWRGT